MADVTIDNGALADFKADTTTLSGAAEVQRIELVTAVEAGASTNLAKAEDTAHGSGDMGIMMLAVRKDAAAALATTDSDYIPLITDASGNLYINIQSMPGAARTTDTVSSAAATDVIMNNLTALTPKWAVIDHATSGDNTIVAAVTSKKIRVHQVFFTTAAAVTIRFESGAGGTALTGQMLTPVGMVLPFSRTGWFETAAGVLLNMELSGATSVDGALQYTEV